MHHGPVTPSLGWHGGLSVSSRNELALLLRPQRLTAMILLACQLPVEAVARLSYCATPLLSRAQVEQLKRALQEAGAAAGAEGADGAGAGGGCLVAGLAALGAAERGAKQQLELLAVERDEARQQASIYDGRSNATDINRDVFCFWCVLSSWSCWRWNGTGRGSQWGRMPVDMQHRCASITPYVHGCASITPYMWYDW